MANESFAETFKINQSYARDFLYYLTFCIQKSEMEEIEEKFQQTLRDAKRRK